MCEKCKELAKRSVAAHEAITSNRGEDALRNTYESALCQSITVQFPVAVGKFIFPILQILHLEKDNNNPIALAFAFADMAQDIREAIDACDRFYPTAAVTALTAMDDICHNSNEALVSYLEAHVYE